MRITTNYESPLVLKNIMITDGIFKRTEDSLENVELRVNVAHNIEQLSEVEYKITLELSVADPEGKLSVFVKGMAVFETEQENKMLIERNTNHVSIFSQLCFNINYTARYDADCSSSYEHCGDACTEK